MTIFDTNHNNRQKWIDIIKSYTGETDDINVIQYCLSYTIQSLRHGEDMNRFKWRLSMETCKTCAIRYPDGFCMQHCYYTGDEQSCDLWSKEPLEFDYKRIYRLCEQYVKLCKDYNEHEELKEKYPKHKKSLSLMDSNYDFFFNCCLNDLHREMSLWRTRR